MKEKLNLEQRILDLVLATNYQPLKPKAIAKKLKLSDEEREVKRTIKRLIKKGKLIYGPRHLVMRPTRSQAKSREAARKSEKSAREVIGQFRKAAGGFGFVIPQDAKTRDRSEDIFIPRHKTLDAADRDQVRIRLSSQRTGPHPKRSGRILEVLERHSSRFVGTYREQAGQGWVDVDGNTFDEGILVGDASAKNGRVGDKVVIEMVHFPSTHEVGEGVIVEILGDRGQPGVDTLSIIRQYDLPDEFPEKVLEDARQQAAAFHEDEIGDRTDFRDRTVITIDPKTARDFDDAISLQQLENGHWQLGVHIADVSHFVPLRSELDHEAYSRSTSVYLPDRVIPMLPEIISNNLASLQPHRVRYCMSALIEFTPDGVPVDTEMHRGVIHSDHRFTYEEVDSYLENRRPWKKKLKPDVFRLLGDMHSLAMQLRRRRMDGGAINLILPETRIDLDEDGKVAGAHHEEHTESHQIIEEFMLAANEAVARFLDDRDLHFLRRVHPTPDENKLAQLTNFVEALGIECGSLQDRFELKRVVEASEGLPVAHAVHFAVLRSMQKAVYSPEELGHYALNSQFYCHFTSPIRRYPDLVIHRMIGDLIDGRSPDSSFDRLMMLGKHCSEREKRAADAERELTKLKLLNFLSDRIGLKLPAVITGVESFGVFVQGTELPAEGLLPVASLPIDTYRYDRDLRVLTGHRPNHDFRLGDAIMVKVAEVDPDRRMLEFDFVGRPPGVKRRSISSNSSRRSSGGKRTSGRKPKGDSRAEANGRKGSRKPKPAKRKRTTHDGAASENAQGGRKRKSSKVTSKKKASSKKTGTKKAGTKNAGTKKAGTKKASTRKSGSKRATAKKPASRKSAKGKSKAGKSPSKSRGSSARKKSTGGKRRKSS